MRFAVAALSLLLLVTVVGASEQQIVPLNQDGDEQHLEIVTQPGGEQHVQAIEPGTEQQVLEPGESSEAKKVASGVAKGMIAVASVALSLAAMAAAMLAF